MINNNEKFYNRNITLMRNIRKISQVELAEKIGVSKQYIHSIEKNKIPSEETIDCLCKYLKVKRNFFYTYFNNVINDDDFFFRKQKKEDKKSKMILKELKSKHVILIDFFDFIESKVKIPKYKTLDSFTPKNRNDIEIIAENFRNKLGIDLFSPIYNLTNILENIGIIILEISIDDKKLDAFCTNIQRPIIVRNKFKSSLCRKRFDLAHELGHIIMHQIEYIDHNKIEKEANDFASALLLPRLAFVKEFDFLSSQKRINWRQLKHLKSKWRVSFSAIFKRAYDLDIISGARYKQGLIHINRNKLSDGREDLDDLLPIDKEKESFFPSLMKFLLNKKKYIINEFIQRNGIIVENLSDILNYSIDKSELSENNIINLDDYRK